MLVKKAPDSHDAQTDRKRGRQAGRERERERREHYEYE